MLVADKSPPNEPIAPPNALLLGVPLGVSQDNLKASSGVCAFTNVVAPMNTKNKNFFIMIYLNNFFFIK
jgi:hypothetical protein